MIPFKNTIFEMDEKNDISNDEMNISEDKILELEDKLNGNLNFEVYETIINYSYTEVLKLLEYALDNNLGNIKKLFYPYWKE